jgi:hypothetical protein
MTTASRPIVHLFAGLHKTGTSAFRCMILWHRDLFARYGYHIPLAGWTTYVDHHINGGHNNIPWEICGHGHVIPEYGSLTDLVQEIGRFPDRQHIVFSEDFDFMQPPHIATLKEAFAGFDVRVIVFVRNQQCWLTSLYAEEQKWYYKTDFPAWFARRFGQDHRFDFHSFCRNWAESFDRITIRAYEQIKSHILDAFLECCNAPDSMRREFAKWALPQVNATPGEFPLALIRHATEIASASGIDESHAASFTMPMIMLACEQIQHVPRQRSAAITRDVANVLFPFMRASNEALARSFGLTLGPEYLNPVWPQQTVSAEEPTFSMAELAKAIVLTCCNMTTNSIWRMQRLADSSGQSLDGVAAQRVRQFYPWQRTSGLAVSLLDELMQRVQDTHAAALYIQRDGLEWIAHHQIDGIMHQIRKLSKQEWHALLLAVQRRASMNVLADNIPKEGRLVFPSNAEMLTAESGSEPAVFHVHLVPTNKGDVLMIRPWSAVTNGHVTKAVG